jgi:hypothetical protein
MGNEKTGIVDKLRQLEEHARTLTGELPAGPVQNRARLIWGLASQLVLKHAIEHEKARVGIMRPAPPRPSDGLED